MSTTERDIFHTLCINHFMKPHAVHENLKLSKSSKDCDGKTISLFPCSIHSVQSSSHAILSDKRYVHWPGQIIIKEMNANIKSIFEDLYPHHAKSHDQNGHHQISTNFEILLPLLKERSRPYRGLWLFVLSKFSHKCTMVPQPSQEWWPQMEGQKWEEWEESPMKNANAMDEELKIISSPLGCRFTVQKRTSKRYVILLGRTALLKPSTTTKSGDMLTSASTNWT